MKIHTLYRSVTNCIIKDLDAGVASWTKPWKNGCTNGIMPHNGATHRSYHGINVMILWCEREEKGYRTANWMTYQQAKAIGAQVRVGEKATTIVFTKKFNITDRETLENKTIPMLKTYTVFNADQIDGLPIRELKIVPPGKRIEHVEQFAANTAAQISIRGNKACYIPSLDMIALPEKHQFKSLEHFYATELHELGHWTGAKQRLDRDLSHRFGSKAYAAEELVAELTAAFLCAELQIPGELRHAEYIASWINLLKEDPKAIFTAAGKASQAAEYLKAFSEHPLHCPHNQRALFSDNHNRGYPNA